MTKTYKVVTSLISDMKYFNNFTILEGLILSLPHYGINITEDSIADVKDAFTDYFFGGCEPEWENESHWKYWDAISPDWFKDGKCLKKLSDFES